MAEIIVFDASKTISFKPKDSTSDIYDFSNEIKKRCPHLNIGVDPELGYIECRECHEHLDPIQYLYKIACSERLIDFRRDQMLKYEKQIEEKNRCKCEKCGEMTRIVR